MCNTGVEENIENAHYMHLKLKKKKCIYVPPKKMHLLCTLLLPPLQVP